MGPKRPLSLTSGSIDAEKLENARVGKVICPSISSCRAIAHVLQPVHARLTFTRHLPDVSGEIGLQPDLSFQARHDRAAALIRCRNLKLPARFRKHTVGQGL